MYDPLRMDPCDHCKNWGDTVTIWEAGGMLVPCSQCGRGTWANLGVNVPAGASVALGFAHPQAIYGLGELTAPGGMATAHASSNALYSLACLDAMRKNGIYPAGEWSHTVMDGQARIEAYKGLNPRREVKDDTLKLLLASILTDEEIEKQLDALDVEPMNPASAIKIVQEVTNEGINPTATRPVSDQERDQ